MLSGQPTRASPRRPSRLRHARRETRPARRCRRLPSRLMEEIERLAEEFLAAIPSYVWDGATPAGPDRGDRRHPRRPARARRRGPRHRARARPSSATARRCPACCSRRVGEIWVNAEEARQWPARRRFTIAHELGHWRLHRDAETRRLLPLGIDRARRRADSRAAPARRGRGQRVRRRGADAGAAGPGAVRPLRPRLLPPVRHVRRVRRGDGAAAARRDQVNSAAGIVAARVPLSGWNIRIARA